MKIRHQMPMILLALGVHENLYRDLKKETSTTSLLSI